MTSEPEPGLDVTFHCSPLRYRELMKADEDNAKLRAALRACQEERDDLQRKCSEAFDSEVRTARRVLKAERALSETVQALQALEAEIRTASFAEPHQLTGRRWADRLARLRATLPDQAKEPSA